MKVIAVYNIKGGVGKTATAVNLSYLSSREGRPTLLWDVDPQGAASFTLRIKPKVKGGGRRLVQGKSDPERLIKATDFEDLDLLPADFSYRKMDVALDAAKKPAERIARLLQPLAREYDRLFIDCPPSISRLSEGIFVAADALLVPTIPTPLSLITLERLLKHLKRRRHRRLEVLPFFCMVDCRKTLHREITARRNASVPMLHSTIPYSTFVEKMSVHRAPLAVFAGWTAAARSYEELWREVAERLEGRGGEYWSSRR